MFMMFLFTIRAVDGDEGEVPCPLFIPEMEGGVPSPLFIPEMIHTVIVLKPVCIMSQIDNENSYSL